MDYVSRLKFGEPDVTFEVLVLEDSAQVHSQPIVVAEGEAGFVEVSADDGDLDSTDDRELMGLLYESSSPLVESILVSVQNNFRKLD